MTKRPDSYYAAWRYRGLLGMFVVLAGLLGVRLFYLQVMQNDTYVAAARQQHGLQRIVPATRGTIRTADGFDLATTQPAYLVYGVPPQVEDVGATADTMTDILYDDNAVSATGAKTTRAAFRQKLVDQLERKQQQWVPLARKVDYLRAERLRAAKLTGIMLETEQKRYYPEGTLAAQVLGFVGRDEAGEDQGYYGIEGFFDRDLRGKDGEVALEKDAAGNPIPLGDVKPKPVAEGATITLTLQRDLQFMLEQKLREGIEKNGAVGGSVILMEPATGRILAMANSPTYNPSDWANPQVQRDGLFRNGAISDTYEPGSVVKTFTAATGLEIGAFTPTTRYDSRPLKVLDHTITNAGFKYYGSSTVTEILEHSDNTGAAQMGQKVGREQFLAYLRKIGLGTSTDLTLEGESEGIIPPTSQWSSLTLSTASFGQGISVTPMQLLNMVSTVANDGVGMKPTIIQSIDRGGVLTEVKPESTGRVYSSATSRQMRDILASVVRNGEFRRLALQGYDIGGKTSTAQIPENGGYDPNKVITTFVGFAPADKPSFVMLVKLDKPRITNSAETVVPVWMDMAKELFRRWGIAVGPTPTPATTTVTPTIIPPTVTGGGR